MRHHKERPDGQGYPDGLRSGQIPIGSAIIGVAEAFDAMTHHRAWRPSRSRPEALAEIARLSGAQFVPVVAEALLERRRARGAGLMRLADALAALPTASAGSAASAPPGGAWLAVGKAASRALTEAARGRDVRIRQVADIHRALEVLDSDTYEGCVIDAPRLGDRPAAALELLRVRLDAERVIVLDRKTPPEVRRLVRSTGALLCTPQSRRAPSPASSPSPAPSPLPRADRAPSELPSPGRFAQGCISRSEDSQALLAFVLDTFTRGTGAGRASVMLLDETRRSLIVRRASGLDEGLVGTVRCPVGSGVAGRAAALGRAVAGTAECDGPRGYSGTSYVVFPLGGASACEGVVNLTGFPEDRLPAGRALTRWVQMAELAGRALATARRLERAESLMATDPLTGLPNRRSFELALAREVERAGRAGTALAVALFDIDHFKAVNDEYGHPAGDRALVHVARVLEAAFRESDLVARWGGEEFAALLPATGAAAPDAALAALERARQRLAARSVPLGPDLPAIRITASCGVGFHRTNGRDAASLIRAADAALYTAKGDGRNCVRHA